MSSTQSRVYLRLHPIQRTEPPTPRTANDDPSTSSCYYAAQVYYCCHAPYTTSYPPQIRHQAPCPFSSTTNSTNGNTKHKLICPNLCKTPQITEIPRYCNLCFAIKKAGQRRIDFHGEKDMLPGEWVIGMRRDGKGEGVSVDKWIRIDKEGWREWGTRKGEAWECEILVVIDGVEWVVFR